jgi:hypothetical protein
VIVQRLDGSWSGVCPHGIARLINGVLVVARLDSPKIPMWTRDVGAIRNVDCWSHEARQDITVGYTSGSTGADLAFAIRQYGDPIALGKAKSIHVRRKNGAWVAMLSHPDGKWSLIGIDTREILDKGQDVKWSSMGIIDVTPDWKPVWAYTSTSIGPVKLQNIRRAGAWIAAQGSNPSSLLVAHQQTVGRLLLGEARETKVAALGDWGAAVISRVEKGYGVAFAVLTPADVASLPKPTQPPAPDPPDLGDEMTSAEYIDLRATLKRIETKVDRALDALDEIPVPTPDDDDDIPAPAPEQPVIAIESVTWLGKESPLPFAVTARITDVTLRKKDDDGSTPYSDDNWELCVTHTKYGEWPVHDNGEGVKYDRNICVFGRVNGRWYGDTAEVMKVGRPCKRLTNRTERDSWGIGPHTKHEPLRSWGPKSGEWFGLMVCTPVREGAIGDVHERSQIYMQRWP